MKGKRANTGQPRTVIFKDAAGEWRWRLVEANNKIIASSAEGYTERNDCLEAWLRVRVAVAAAEEIVSG